VFADDKARILGHVEQQLPSALTVHVRQGRYADDPVDPGDPPPDVEIAAGWNACLTSIMRPAAQERIKALLKQGFHQPGDAENRLGFYLGQLGR